MRPEFVLDDHGIVDADRLGHGNLHAGEKVGQQRPRREAGDDAGDAGRGEQRHPVLAHRLEGHQREADGHQRDHRIEHAHKNPHLRHVLARQEIVLDVKPEAAEVEVACHTQRGCRDPAEQTNRRQPQQPGQKVLGRGPERRRGQGDRKRNQQKRDSGRILGGAQHRPQVRPPLAGQPAPEREDPGMQQPCRNPGTDEQRR